MLNSHYAEWAGLNSQFIGQLEIPVKRLQALLRKGQGARIGEAAVISRNLHAVQPHLPEEIQIFTNNDAGQIFYQREKPGEIIHLDVFHEVGKVDPGKVATGIRKAIDTYNFHVTMQKLFLPTHHLIAHCADFIDVQTAVGGGRVTGSLGYGQKESLRRAHENHVHVAAMLGDELLPLVFYIVLAVEAEITAAGLEIRKNERIVHIAGTGTGTADLSPYSTNSDSYLQQTKPQTAAGNQHRQMRLASDLMQEFQDIQDAQAVLESFAGETQGRKLQTKLQPHGDPERIVQKLRNMGLVDQTANKLQLSEAGKELQQFLLEHAPEVEAQMKRVIRQLPVGIGAGSAMQKPDNKKQGSGPPAGRAEVLSQRDWAGELSVPDTIVQALKRNYRQGLPRLHITREDLCERKRLHIPGHEICLLIDASASMVGSRMQATKYLVKHLLLTNRGRIAVVVFQEKGAKVVVPFTRDYRQIEVGLKEMRPYGATPLARGIHDTMKYLEGVYVKNPTILLITDGVPTIGDRTKDAVADAIDAACAVKQRGIHFSCIGLQPHQRYLQQVTEAAGGIMYAVEELEKNLLVKIAWQDRHNRGL